MTAPSNKRRFRIVQITDTHLLEDPASELLKMNTQHSLDRVLELIAGREKDADLLLATGDVSQDASPASYRRFCQSAEDLGVPFHWLPGNHDHPALMQEVKGLRKRLRFASWQIILLDSSIRDAVHGVLARTELDYLEKVLGEAGKGRDIEHSLVCLHHNPIPASSQWMRDIGLRNSGALMDILGRHESVRGVVFGHIHQEVDRQYRGQRCLCAPSTSVQFRPGARDFELDPLNPGYRWLSLEPDGGIDSGVVRLQGRLLSADFDSEGY